MGVEVLGQEYVVARMGWGATEGSDKKEKVDVGDNTDSEKPLNEKVGGEAVEES